MNYKIFIILFLITSCSQNPNKLKFTKPYSSKGLAYIYNDKDYDDKIIKKKFNNELLQIGHNKLRPGSLIKIINSKTNDFIVIKNSKKVEYPDFYKILITNQVAIKLKLPANLPFVEVVEVKKNKSFIAEKTKIFKEEEKIHNKAPVELVKIDNLSKDKQSKNKVIKDKFYIVIGEFYSINSVNLLKKRIINELTNFSDKNLYTKREKTNKITLLSGPYNSINLLKNDYIQLKKFGFEELDININE